MRAGNRIGAGPVLVLAAVGYLAGLALFLASSPAALAAVADPLLAVDVDSFLTILQAPGFVDPHSFVVSAIDQPSPALLFPVGAVCFPLVLAVHAIRTSRASWWVPAGFALGPLAGLGLATNPVVVTVAVDLALYVVSPAIAVVGSLVSVSRE